MRRATVRCQTCGRRKRPLDSGLLPTHHCPDEPNMLCLDRNVYPIVLAKSGNPRNPRSQRSRKIQLWADPAEKEKWRAAAKAEGMDLSAWLRRAANRQRVVESRRHERDVRERG